MRRGYEAPAKSRIALDQPREPRRQIAPAVQEVDDDDGVGYNSAITFPLDAGQTVYLFVDGYTGFGASWQGSYALTVEPALP